MYPGALVMAPPAMAVSWTGALNTLNFGKYDAPQSPTMPQSAPGVTAAKRGNGALVDAVPTGETGASEMLSWATAGVAVPARPIKVGNCAFSIAVGFASTTS